MIRPNPEGYVDINSKIYIITNARGIIRDISPLGYMNFKIDREYCQSKFLS